jgi:hypothetical protein
MTCSLSFVKIGSGSYSRCRKHHHLDLSRRSVATASRDHLQAGRIVRLGERDQGDAALARGMKLARSASSRGQMRKLWVQIE